MKRLAFVIGLFLLVPHVQADTILTSNVTYNSLQIATGSVLRTNGWAVNALGSATGGTLIYGKLVATQSGASSTLFTQSRNYFRTSGAGGVQFVSTGARDSDPDKSPGTCADDSSYGTNAWASPTNAQVSDNSRASATVTAGSPSHYLKCTNFGFYVPAGATIVGIKVDIERNTQTTSTESKDDRVRIVKSDASIGTTDKADTSTVWPTADAYASYGGSTDLWGETWTPSDINDSDFGVVLAVQNVDFSGAPVVDHMRITVYYSHGSGTGTLLLTGSGSDAASPFALTVSGALQTLKVSSGLSAYWKLDEGIGGSGSYVSDRSLNAVQAQMQVNPQTWSGASLNAVPPTRFYNPYSIDFKANGCLKTGSTSAGNPGKGITVAAWVKPDVTTANTNIMTNQVAGSIANGEWRLSIGTAGMWRLRFTTSATSNAESATNFSVGVWHHVAGTWDGATIRLFADGVKTASAARTGAANALNNPIVIGASMPCSAAHWDGMIDDVRIYNRPLSASEIQALYQGYQNTGSGVYVLGSPLTVSGSLAIHAGKIDVSSNNFAVSVTGSWLNVGEFTARSGTVFLGKNTQTMTGSTVFNNLTKVVTVAKTLFMDFSGRQSASGALTLRGVVSNLLSIRSTKTGTGARLLLDGDSGTQTIDYLDVKDSNASGGAELVCYATAEGCTNSGNNTNWNFTDVVESIRRVLNHMFFIQ